MKNGNKFEISSLVPGFSVYVEKWIKNPESQFDFSILDIFFVRFWKVENTLEVKICMFLYNSIMVSKMKTEKKFVIVKK